jgi:hypothetical protein
VRLIPRPRRAHGRAVPRSLVLLLVLAACTSDGSDGSDGSDEPTSSTAAPDLDVVAGESDGATLGPPHLGDLTLDLPVDCTVRIEESVISFSGREYDITHDLTFSSEADGNVLVTRVNPEVTRVILGGRDIGAGGEGDLRLARLPSVVVDASGQVVDLRGLEELMAEADPVTDEVLPAIEARYISDAIDKSWHTWVGAWADWGTIEEPTEQRELEDGTEVPLSFSFTSVGTTGRGLAVLRASADIDQERLEAVVGELPDGALDGAEVDGSIFTEVVTDPATLRPASAVYEHEVVLTQDGQVAETIERRAVQFDWASSDCG